MHAADGDMAITQFNAVSNLLEDCTSGRIDAFAHMGDHCYNLGQADDRRGDAYVRLPTLTSRIHARPCRTLRPCADSVCR